MTNLSEDELLWEQEIQEHVVTEATAAWEAAPVYQPERSLLIVLRIGRRLRKLLRIG